MGQSISKVAGAPMVPVCNLLIGSFFILLGGLPPPERISAQMCCHVGSI
jgi:hypothetical protein